jgi:hypothetical protein
LPVAKLDQDYQHHHPAMTVYLQELPGLWSLMYRDESRQHGRNRFFKATARSIADMLRKTCVIHIERSISSVGLERGANNAKVLGSTPILTIVPVVDIDDNRFCF